MKRVFYALSTGLLSTLLLLSGCSSDTPVDSQGTTTTTAPSGSESVAVVAEAKWDDEDRDGNPDIRGATVITLADGASTVEGDGAAVKDDVITVEAGGSYVVRGALTDGQLRVESNDSETVRLVLDGITIHSESTAPLFIKKSAKTIVTLAANSQNVLSDSENAVYEDETDQEPSGALFSKSDLTINGDGALTVTAAFNDGIVSRDGLKIAGGAVSVTAADDAVMGRDYVLVGGGVWKLDAAGDGIKSTNDAGDGVGYIRVEGGSITVVSDKDGVQAQTALDISGGKLDITAGGGSSQGTANQNNDFGWGYQSTDTESVGKGLKAGGDIAIAGGNMAVNAADDAVHSNANITITGGEISAAAGDDGVHADTSVTVSGGTLIVTRSYEALEAGTITLEDGNLSLTASDDGVNASLGTTGSTGDPGGGNPFASDDSAFIINGGTLYVDAGGDGLDSNGVITMNGGTVTVCGPSNSGNGTFDFGSAFNIRGGTLIGVGSLGMAEDPTSNTQNSIVWSGCSLQSGDAFTVTSADGTVVASITSARTAQWAYVTSPDLAEGETYTLTDGSSTQSITLQSGVNTIGTAMGGMQGGMPGGNMGGPMGGPGGHPGGWR